MSTINKYISDADLEKKLEMIMLEGNGRMNDECQTCGGLLILHKPGACTRKDKNDEMLIGKVELKAELFDRMEVFRMKRKVEEVKKESEMEKLCKMMGDNNKKFGGKFGQE